MESWVVIDEFVQISKLEKEKVLKMVSNGELKGMQKDGKFYIDASSSAKAVVVSSGNAVMVDSSSQGSSVDSEFVEKTIGTILSLHEKVITSKEETISSIKSENQFLKDALFNTQEVYEDDKKTIALLREQLRVAQEEIEFLKRKYKMMWGKVVNPQENKEQE